MFSTYFEYVPPNVSRIPARVVSPGWKPVE
jgi:hypothetical protein